MVTDRTPPHKRIARAEKAREEWKVKATKRREENQLLKANLAEKTAKLEMLFPHWSKTFPIFAPIASTIICRAPIYEAALRMN